jgi:cell volume regulation protein A
LVLLSIFAGLVFTRIGAPLLLVFLGLGMLAGENGIGGLAFSDFRLTYLVGNVALAIILFDGALRTPRAALRLAAGPAIVLATVGTSLTAFIVGLAAAPLLGLSLTEGVLMGAILASTDAAAVFLLLNRRGGAIERRVGATLEVESGFNDPMAVFLTLLLVEALQHGGSIFSLGALLSLLQQMGGGAVIGLAGGYAMLWVVNRVNIATGLYPILVVAFAVFVFAAAQSIHGSGFLAVYLTGLVFGFGRHRARQLIARFHDGLAWLSQIVMFLLLGLLVTPAHLLTDLAAALCVALVLMLIARPLSVIACLVPFRFARSEIAFVSWVGLRGAVPIFLATIPVVAGLPHAATFFNVAFVAVIASLVLQGWTILPAARWLGLIVPAAPDTGDQVDLGTLLRGDRDLLAYKVGRDSIALRRDFSNLKLPERARVLAVLRNNAVLQRVGLDQLKENDTLLMLAPPESTLAIDRLFAANGGRRPIDVDALGDFIFEGSAPAGPIAGLYSLPLTPAELDRPIGEVLARRLKRKPVIGDRIDIGTEQLVVADTDEDGITRVGLFLRRRRPPVRGMMAIARRRYRQWRRRLSTFRGRKSQH